MDDIGGCSAFDLVTATPQVPIPTTMKDVLGLVHLWDDIMTRSQERSTALGGPGLGRLVIATAVTAVGSPPRRSWRVAQQGGGVPLPWWRADGF